MLTITELIDHSPFKAVSVTKVYVKFSHYKKIRKRKREWEREREREREKQRGAERMRLGKKKLCQC